MAVDKVRALKKFLGIGLLGFMATCQAFGQSASDEQRIREARAKSNEFIARHDAAGAASLLDSEYQITTGDGDFFRESPREDAEAWKQIFAARDDVIYVRTPHSVEVSAYLPLASEIGTWTGFWTTPDGPREIGGRYSASWRNVEGEWKIHAELFVTLYCNGSGC